jgi:3-phenylpropionate/cinnamic acid dioxygenase small subunit
MTETLTVPAATSRFSLSDPRVLRAVELIWHEADLLDRKEYVAWNDLYSEDGHYIVPIDPHTQDFDNTLNMIYDDARMRGMRVTRMIEGYAIAAVDAARTVRTVSRFVPTSVSDEQVVVRSAQVIVAYKRGRHDLWAGEVEHRIRLSAEGPDGDRITRKVVRLVDSEGAPPAAGFLL